MWLLSRKEILLMVLLRFYRPYKSSQISIIHIVSLTPETMKIRGIPNLLINKSRTPMFECYDSPAWNTLGLPSPAFWKDGLLQRTDSKPPIESPTLLTQMSNLPWVSAIIFTIAIFCVSWRNQWNNPQELKHWLEIFQTLMNFTTTVIRHLSGEILKYLYKRHDP